MLVAELDDVLRGHRADPLDRVELLDRRGAEADRAGRRSQPASPATAPRQGPGLGGTTTCWPSASRAARLIASTSALAVAPPARCDRVVDARTGRQAVDARAGDRARPRRRRRRVPPAASTASAPPEPAPLEESAYVTPPAESP